MITNKSVPVRFVSEYENFNQFSANTCKQELRYKLTTNWGINKIGKNEARALRALEKLFINPEKVLAYRHRVLIVFFFHFR